MKNILSLKTLRNFSKSERFFTLPKFFIINSHLSFVLAAKKTIIRKLGRKRVHFNAQIISDVFTLMTLTKIMARAPNNVDAFADNVLASMNGMWNILTLFFSLVDNN